MSPPNDQRAPSVEFHEPNPGDPVSKELWELWGQVAEAERVYRDNVREHAEAQREVNSASVRVGNSGNKLRELKEKLIKKLNAPAEPDRGHEVPK